MLQRLRSVGLLLVVLGCSLPGWLGAQTLSCGPVMAGQVTCTLSLAATVTVPRDTLTVVRVDTVRVLRVDTVRTVVRDTVTVLRVDTLRITRVDTVFVTSAPPPALPRAEFTVACTGLTCTFDGSPSTGVRLSYRWSLNKSPGDAATGKIVTTTYAEASTRLPKLTVTDSLGRTATVQKTITVAPVPADTTGTPLLLLPPSNVVPTVCTVGTVGCWP